MRKHLVLVGAGHAHLVTLANLHRLIRRGYHVTVIGSSEHHYYSGMGPGMLGLAYTARQIRFATRQIVEKQGAAFVRACVTHIDPDKQKVFMQSGDICHYDVLSFNAGSYIPYMATGKHNPSLFKVKPIERLLEARQRLIDLGPRQYVKVAVIGGGAAAIEVAGNTERLLCKHGRNGFEIHLFTRGKILHRFPPKVRAAVLSTFGLRGIRIHENKNVLSVSRNRIDFNTGCSCDADLIFLATGVMPSTIFQNSGLPTGPDGGLKVNCFLQCPQYPNIFGGGDCIYFQENPLEKVGVYAVRQNPVLYYNLTAALGGLSPRPFSPGGAYMLILNLGNGKGLLHKRGIMFGGQLAFFIKDRIDRRFMHRFQALE